MSYKIYKSLGHSHTRARQNRKAMNPETVLTIFFRCNGRFWFHSLSYKPYSPEWRVLFQHR